MSIAVAIASFLLLRPTPESRVDTSDQKPFDWSGLFAFVVGMVGGI